jgi:microcystin-dependent protein
MTDPFLGQVQMMSFNFAPKGWAQCNGQLMPINQNQALFSLLGTTFGGDGKTTFGLPEMRGRAPTHVGPDFVLGQKTGETTHTLTAAEIGEHTHTAQASGNDAAVAAPGGNVLGGTANLYANPDALQALIPATISPQGGSQPHENRQPYLAVNFCIALQGIFPAQN